MQQLAFGAARLGLHLSQEQLAQFNLFRRELLATNRTMNLTAITDPDQIVTKHFLDSLTVATAFPTGFAPGTRLLDVGSGGGFPGIPLKIAFPSLSVTLLESTRKKAAFLMEAANRLGLAGVLVVAERAEDAARQSQHREAYDVVIARALAPLPALAELTLPFCRIGGAVVAHKKGGVAAEVQGAATAITRLGGRTRECRPVTLPGLDDGRMLVIMDKVAPTSAQYPRRAGIPAKRPLGLRGT